MPRHQIPVDFYPSQPPNSVPAFQLENKGGHKISVHALTPGLVRVAHELPEKYKPRSNGGIHWENSALSYSNGLIVCSHLSLITRLLTDTMRYSLERMGKSLPPSLPIR